MKKENNLMISRAEAAEILFISIATVRNWEKSGLLKSENGLLRPSEVQRLSRLIENGEIQKLTKRANKKGIHKLSIKPSDDGEILKDISGSKYQNSKSAALRSKEGSFYTPEHIIDEIVKDYISAGKSVYDPCCGTGRFLIRSYELSSGKVSIRGRDKDAEALKIAETSLSGLGSKDHELIHSDSLKTNEDNYYDLIFTNPPWGAYIKYELKEFQKLYSEAKTDDSLGFFILKGIRSLKPSGIMSYVLPESFLYSRRFADLRKFILENTSLIKLKSYARPFKNVFSEVVRVDLRKQSPVNNTVVIENGEDSFTLEQDDLKKAHDFRFDLGSDSSDRDQISRFYDKPYITLKNHAEWSLGIVTGDNKRFVSDIQDDDHKDQIITGKNIDRYNIDGHKKYINNNFSLFQQVPKKNLFVVKEKLVYRFISDRLVFALDRSGSYTLNSANILIPKLPGYTICSIMAVLNSGAMNFIYRKKFKSLKVLRSYLEELPFPENPDKKIIDLIDKKTNRIINNAESGKKILCEIDRLTEKLYGVKL